MPAAVPILLQLGIGVAASRRIHTEDDYLVAGRSLGPVLAIVIAYTIFGGLLANAWTDLVQGVALIIGLAALAWAVGRAEGFDALAALEPGMLNPFGAEPRPILAVAEDWAIPIVGSLVAAEVVARILASRSETIARNAPVVAGCSYLLIGLIPVTLGLMGSVLVPGLSESEQILPTLAERYLPTVVAVVFSGALVSAILSTVDSALLVAASLVSHNIVVQLRPDLDERRKVMVARAFVALFGILAYLMAFRAERVYELVEQASAFGSSGIVSPTACPGAPPCAAPPARRRTRARGGVARCTPCR